MREKLTLILFKDHLTSRTLKLPVQWLPRLGLMWLIAMFLTLCLAVLLGRAYLQGTGGGFAAMRSQAKMEELEKQLSEVKSSYEALQARTQGGTAGGAGLDAAGAVGFVAFPPASLRNGLPQRNTLPFRLEPLKAQWKGNSLQLTTAIEYIRDDGGNQQGHFVIFARGPQNLYTYPDGALSPAGTDVLVRPEAGEYFSVSRYREIKASFGPAQTRDSIQSIELYIFDSKKNLIFAERAGVEAPKTKEPPKPASPSPSSPAASRPDTAEPAAGAAIITDNVATEKKTPATSPAAPPFTPAAPAEGAAPVPGASQ